jgi:hypothetical protein
LLARVVIFVVGHACCELTGKEEFSESSHLQHSGDDGAGGILALADNRL